MERFEASKVACPLIFQVEEQPLFLLEDARYIYDGMYGSLHIHDDYAN